MLRSTLGRMSMSPSKSSPNLASPSAAAATPSTPPRSSDLKAAQQQQYGEPSATFTLVQPNGTPKQAVTLYGPCVTLGRAPEADLRLVKSTISRIHAKVFLPAPGSGQHMTLNVTGSSGLKLNGEHLVTGSVAPLKSSDRICIDRWYFRVELDAAAPMPELMTPARGTATPRRRMRMSLMDAGPIETPHRRGSRRSSTRVAAQTQYSPERDIILVEEIEEEPEPQQQQHHEASENVEPDAAAATSSIKNSPRKRERRRSSFFGYASTEAAPSSSSPQQPSSSTPVASTSLDEASSSPAAPSLNEAPPRMPRSLSSPSRLSSPVKHRKVSLRTQTLLRGCEEFIERERRAEITQARRSLLGASEPVGAREAEMQGEAETQAAMDAEDVEMSDAEEEDAAAAAAEEEEQQQQHYQEGLLRSNSSDGDGLHAAEYEQDEDADEVDRSLSLLEDVEESDEEAQQGANTPSKRTRRSDLGAFLTPQVQRHAAKSRTSLPGTVMRHGETPDRGSWTAYLPAAIAEQQEQEGDRSVEEVVREILEEEQGTATDREDDVHNEEEEELDAAPLEEALHEPAVAALAHLLDAANAQGPETPSRSALRTLISTSSPVPEPVAPSTPRYGGLYASITSSPAARLLASSAPKTPDMRGLARLFARGSTYAQAQAETQGQATPDAAFLKHIFALPPSAQEDVSITDLRALFGEHEDVLRSEADEADDSAAGEALRALLATPQGYEAVLKAAESIVRPAVQEQQETQHEADESVEDVPVRRGSPSKAGRKLRQSLAPGPIEQALLVEPEGEASETQEEAAGVEEQHDASLHAEVVDAAAGELEEAVPDLADEQQEEIDVPAAQEEGETVSQKEATPIVEASNVALASEEPEAAPEASVDVAFAPEEATPAAAVASTPSHALTPRSSVRRPRLTTSSAVTTPAATAAVEVEVAAVASTPASTRTRRAAPGTASRSKQAQASVAEVAKTPKAATAEASQSQSRAKTPATTRRTRNRTEEDVPAMPSTAAEEVEAVASSEVDVPAKRSRARGAASTRKVDEASSAPPSSDVAVTAAPSSDVAPENDEPERAKRGARKAATTAKSRLRKPATGPSSAAAAAAAAEEDEAEAVSSPAPKASRSRRAKSVAVEEDSQVPASEPAESQAAEEQEEEQVKPATAPKARATRAKTATTSTSKLPTRSRRAAAAVAADSSDIDEAQPMSQATDASETDALPAKRTRAKTTRTMAASAAEEPASQTQTQRNSLGELPSELNAPSSDVEVPSSSVKTRTRTAKTTTTSTMAKPATRKAASSTKAPSSDVAEPTSGRATRSRAAAKR